MFWSVMFVMADAIQLNGTSEKLYAKQKCMICNLLLIDINRFFSKQPDCFKTKVSKVSESSQCNGRHNLVKSLF